MAKAKTRDIAFKKVITVAPEDSITTAAGLMRDKSVGCVVVIEEGKPVGIITDRDIAVRVVAEGLNSDDTTVGDVMTQNVITANEDERAAELLELIQKYGIRRIPIVDAEGKLTGIITLDDLLQIVGINVGVNVQFA